MVWLIAALNFGVLLFFSENGSVMNPKMPIWPSVAKDGMWLLLLVSSTQTCRGTWGRAPLMRFFAPAGLLLCVMALGVLLNEGMNVGLGFVKSLKNATLYMLMPVVLATAWRVRIEEFAIIVAKCLVATVIFSIFVYLLFEFNYKPDVPDLRMFGSTGNPNSAALVSALLFTLVSCMYSKMDAKMRGVFVFFAWWGAYFSASYFYILWMLLVMGYCSIMGVSHENREQVIIYWKEVVLYAVLAWVVASVLVWLTPYDDIPLLLRIHSAIELSEDASLVDSDSVRVRWGAIQMLKITAFGAGGPFVQMDSAILTFLQNFGVIGFFFSVYPAIIAVLFLMKIRFRLFGLEWYQHAFFLVSGLITASGMVHYQVSHFPSNIILYLTLAFFLRDFLVRLQGGRVGKSKLDTQIRTP